jgi:dTDP-4-dehydrorhamnose reductase
MRVLLLGPDGQLGRDIRRAHAASRAAAVSAIDLVPLGRAALDVSAPSAVAEALGAQAFDALINCTSYHRTDEVEDNAGLAFAVNTHAVQAMAEACAARGARFVHISTDYVFGGDRARAAPLAETAPVAPVNVYGASKAMGETLARIACPDALILRVASLFGVDGASGKGGNFVETMLRVGRETGRLRVVADQTMSPTATADVAPALLTLLAREAEPGTYHVVNEGAATWHAFATEIIRRAGVAAEVAPCASADFPTRAMRPRFSVLATARLAVSPAGRLPPWQDALERYLRAKGHT